MKERSPIIFNPLMTSTKFVLMVMLQFKPATAETTVTESPVSFEFSSRIFPSSNVYHIIDNVTIVTTLLNKVRPFVSCSTYIFT